MQGLKDHSVSVVGLITSNAQTSDDVAVPSLGFVLPWHLLRPIFQVCQLQSSVCDAEQSGLSESNADGIAVSLQRLDQPQLALDGLWAAGPPRKAAGGQKIVSRL
jgi:hypothetical protein